MNDAVEVRPEKFLDAKVIYQNNTIKTKVYHNKRKLPNHWS